MALDADGNVIVTDSGNDVIRRITPAGQINTISGRAGEGLRDGARAQAQCSEPQGVAVGPDGSIYRQRRVHRNGGPISPYIEGIAIGSDGALYVADPDYSRVVRITREGELSIVADSGFSSPTGIIATPDGKLLVSDTGTNVIWKITIEDVGDSAE